MLCHGDRGRDERVPARAGAAITVEGGLGVALQEIEVRDRIQGVLAIWGHLEGAAVRLACRNVLAGSSERIAEIEPTECVAWIDVNYLPPRGDSLREAAVHRQEVRAVCAREPVRRVDSERLVDIRLAARPIVMQPVAREAAGRIGACAVGTKRYSFLGDDERLVVGR